MSPYSLTEFGGVQGQVLGLARALRELGADARVIGPCDGPPPEPGVTSVGRSTTRWEANDSLAPIASSRAVAARTLEAIRVFEPDVLHLHEPLVPGPTHAALLGTDVPSVGTFHAWYASGPPAITRRFRAPVRAALARLASCTAVSEEAGSMAEEGYDVECEVLFNGVDVARFAKAEPWPTEKTVVLFVGRHEPRKGLDVLLDAWRGLDRDAGLWVAGEGPETEALRSRGVAGVEWLGRVGDDELAQRLRAATVFCAPAVGGESFGVVLLEAMAAGAAVVASDIPGYRNVARPGREALLVPKGDADELRAALHRALDEPETRATLVAAGEARADEFAFRHLAVRYLGVYDKALRRPPVP